jgi:hypothetical protein
MVEKVVECGEGVRRMARFLDDKVRRKQAAMYWTRACCKQKTSMRGCRWCCHEYCLSGDRLRLCEGVYNNAIECLIELLRQCDTSTIKTGRQPHSRGRALIPTPRINAELSEELGEPIFRRRRVLRAVTTATCLPAPMNSKGQASTETLRNVTNVVVVFVLVRRNRRGRCR